MSDLSPEGGPNGRALRLAFTVIVGVSLVGFLAGTRVPAEASARPIPDRQSHEGVPAARSYRELRARALVQQDTWPAARQWFTEHAAKEVPKGTRADAVAGRAQRRAFDGAPPAVPHPIEQREFSDCLSCHGVGLRIGARVASMPSHGPLPSCAQCHPSGVGAAPFDDALRADAFRSNGTYGVNRFEGRRSPGPGLRAWPIAPPAIPHATFMRESCLSCHGDAGAAPLRTPHPDRTSCRQCHPAGAAHDPAARPIAQAAP